MSGSNSVGRVIAFQAIGRGFESRLPLQPPLKLRLAVQPKFQRRLASQNDAGRTCPPKRSEGGYPAHVAQSVERVLGKDEVTSSILVVGSREIFFQVA